MEVLASGLAHDSWIIPQRIKILSDILPKLFKDGRRTGKVQRSEIGMSESGFADELRIAGDELNDTGGQACLLENLVDEVTGEDGHR